MWNVAATVKGVQGSVSEVLLGVDALVWILVIPTHVSLSVLGLFLNIHIYFCGSFQAGKISAHGCRCLIVKELCKNNFASLPFFLILLRNYPDAVSEWFPEHYSVNMRWYETTFQKLNNCSRFVGSTADVHWLAQQLRRALSFNTIVGV